MSLDFTRRRAVKSATLLALGGTLGVGNVGAEHKDKTADNGEGHEEGDEGGPTLNRFATTVIGAEITGMFITERGEFFFNVQHPDTDLDGEDEPGVVGAVNGLNMNELPKDFASVQIPEGDDYDYTDSGDGIPEPWDTSVRTALGSYQDLATGGDRTDNGKELGSVYTPDGDFLTGQINPDFNGFVQSSTEENKGYLFTNWEHRPGAMSRLTLRRRGDGRWDVLSRQNVDFSSVEGTWVNCFGTVSPWGTPLTSEENYAIPDTADWNKPDNSSVERLADSLGMDKTDSGSYDNNYPNPYRYGYIVELEAPENEPEPIKHFAIGRSTHENAVVMPDEKTVYTTSDGTARGFYKFIADYPGDLSAGTLYVANADQQGDIGGDPADVSFDLEWLELGHASNDEIEEWIEDYDDITQEEYVDGGNSYITESEMDNWANGDAADDRVAFLQCRQAAMRIGATTEFRKMEGINVRSDADAGDDYAYVAMANTNKTMGDRTGDIQLNGDEFGAVYRMPLLEDGDGDHDYDIQSMEPVVVGGPNANICGGCPMDAQPNSASKVCQNCQFNPTKESEDGVVGRGMEQVQTVFTEENFGAEEAETTISEPDNIVVMDDGRVVIGEDTGNMGHENNMIWVYNPGDDNETPEMANSE